MKKLARILGVACVLAVALTLALAMPAFAAGGLNFLGSTPESGSENIPVENVGVKLFFDGNVTDASVWENNSRSFKLTDSGGRIVDNIAYAGQKAGEEGYILVLADPTPASENMPGQLEQKTEYTLTISGELMSKEGGKLGSDIVVMFETMDVAANSQLSMIIMVVMMVGAIVLMVITNWRKMKAEAEAAALAKANPYRLAKDKDISVDEAKELIEKAKEKNKKQLEKVGGKAPEPEEKKSAAPRLDAKKKKKKTHKVGGPRPVSEGGSGYKTGRKAAKERKARAEAAKKAAAAQHKTGGGGSAGGGKKGSKGKGKKK